MPDLAGLAPEDVRLRPAVFDEERSAATGQPALALVAEDTFSLTDEPPRGPYVLTLAAPESMAERDTVRWQLALRSDCMLDRVDSFVLALDDQSQPVAPRPETDTLEAVRALCFPTDVDVVPLPAWAAGATVTITVEAWPGVDIPVSVHRVAADNTLAEQIPLTTEIDTFSITLTGVGPSDDRFALLLGPSREEQDEVRIGVVFTGAPGETCGNALPLAGAGGNETATLYGRVDDVDISDFGDCTGYSSTGPDAFYVLELADGEGAQITARPLFDPSFEYGVDISLYALADCAPGAGACLTGSDASSSGGAESIAIPPAPGPRTIFVGIDSFDGYSTAVNLTWERTR
jgi:hypothetical protein